MKKSFIVKPITLVLSAFIMFTGCSLPQSPESDKLSIVTTCFPPYDFARAVAGESADITMLLCPGAEAHSYEPTPLDILKIQQCDVFICIGSTDEIWVDKILESVSNDDMTVIKLIEHTELLEEEDVIGASPTGHDHNHHENVSEHEEKHSDAHKESEENHYDEHIWTSLKNAQLCVNAITEKLSTVCPENTTFYEKNAELYNSELSVLDKEFYEITLNAPEKTIVIGDRFPFRYLTNDYNLDYFAAFSGCSSESEPGVYTMAFLMDEIITHDLDSVFYLEFSTRRLAQKLSDATGAQMLPLHSCHNVTLSDFEKGTTYYTLMKQNLENLKEALY